ncbi:DUF1800 family protein [Ideonella sp. A 288]|uniref:DUF1800 domain-containing protein n=1 Tax=Ideonella sp. A 288 TaxID=1962181 RepID=UPI001F16E7BC|nr:DUF1800 domain-containing protein [Ideonella sp. A 288]
MALGTSPIVGALTAAALLSACGGGGRLPAAFSRTAEAPTRRQILGVAAASDAPLRVPTATELMDWAERAHPQFFPTTEPDQRSAPYVYRHYPGPDNYLGVSETGADAGTVYLLGPVSGHSTVPVAVGRLADYATQVFATQTAFSDAQAARFLAQATLGPTDAAIADVRRLGYTAWLAQEFARPVSPGNWDWLVGKGLDTNPDARNSAIGVDGQVWQRLITAPDSLRQRVTAALAEIFVVGFDGISGPYKQFKLAAWWDLLASHAFGSYRRLLEAVTLNAAMGSYLNTAGNQKENAGTGRLPDENYAREVMQLFSIGLVVLEPDGTPRLDGSGRPIETYTQDMVTQLARVFTGWNVDLPRGEAGPAFARRPMVLNAALHSPLAASFLGTTVPANTPGATALAMALDTLAAHPNVGPFIGRQLIQRLVTSNPSPAYVRRVAAAFADNGAGVRGDLSAVVRAVLLDEEARSDLGLVAPAFGKLREPMLRLVHWARSFKATSKGGDWAIGNTSDAATRLGQSPLRSPSVFNYFRPGYVPAGTEIAESGLVAPEFQLANESSVAGSLNYLRNVVGNSHADLQADYAAELALAGDAAALLARVELLLCADQLQASTRSLIQGAIESLSAGTAAGRAGRVHTAVLLVMASPEYQVQK